MKSRPFNVLVILALFLSLLGSAVTVTPARAASFTVTNANDSGAGSLRQAILDANATGGTIDFNADYTITLVSQLPDITSNITITGNGATKTIIRANVLENVATYGVFHVVSGGSLTLDKLTVKNGKTAGGGGGVAVDSGATLTVTNSTISNNIAGTVGGGIANYGTLTVTNSTFSGNSTPFDGGGILNAGTLTVTNSTFSGNTAAEGGGIYNYSGTVMVTNSTFSGNTANTNGGGIYNYVNNTVTVTDSMLSGNTANTDGGGIYNNTNGLLTVTNSTLSNNIATNGSGGGIKSFGVIAVSNSTFSGNTSTWGGGIYYQGASGVVTNSTFFNNKATALSGGGINNETILTVGNSTFSGNSSSSGGGIYNHGTLIFANTIIANSTSGGDCVNGATINSNINNLVKDGTCNVGTTLQNFKTGDPNLVSLADNGGPTQTMALPAGSIAIDAGDATTCSNFPVSNKDQRGVSRPIDGDAVVGAICDIGAFEYGAIIPVVSTTNPSANAVLTSLSSINIYFNQDMLDDATTQGAENVNNYLLVERGTNGTFDTISCSGGVASDDTAKSISTASYTSAGFFTTLTFPSLANGRYRLFICGTTSIWSAAGLELNNGANDTTVDFTVSASSNGSGNGSSNSSSLPTTGFAPDQLTTLPAQPASSAYTSLGNLWIEIPTLNLKTNIVGVPQTENAWEVKWLGNDAGWLNGTAFPSWEGNSVITGHVTNADGLPGPFANIKDLKYGDQIIVHMLGQQYIFEVRNSRLVRPDTSTYALEHLEKNSYLTLITCADYNDQTSSYRFRRIVRAVLVSVQSE
jgi:LPXTG-site transpeptidase (sortase) family protein